MLNGATVILRAWKEADVPALQMLRNDVELQEMLMAEPRPNSLERTRQWLSERSGREDGLLFVIATAADDQPAGFVQITELDRRNRTAFLGIALLSRSQGMGLGAEALALLEAYLVRVFRLRKLLLKVLTSNTRAIAFYGAASFNQAGLLSRHHASGHGYQDVLIMEKFLCAASADEDGA
ncbi:GNAT family N-acetyltransferase [Methyloversatilis sp.]|uniref:GNAT family N-acetyltransferase n=1 Tax=Methyloversatilis sp. TaxID=2569862 RepID=UPI0027B8FE19|nr:GNAT family protein [Methyloversatilis sp.]